MRWNCILKKLYKIWAIMGIMLACSQNAYAQETVLISGNPKLYPMESYDYGKKSYVGVLPDIYAYLSESTEYNFVYLPYSEDSTQAQQVKNQQADMVSAYLSGTVREEYLTSSFTVFIKEVNGEDKEVKVGFTHTLSEEQANGIKGLLSEALSIESGESLMKYVNVEREGIRIAHYREILYAVIAGVVVLLIIRRHFAEKKRARERATALIDPRYGIGNSRYYFHCLETLIPAPLRSLYYVVCIGGDEDLLKSSLITEKEVEELFLCAAEFINESCGREEYLSCVDRGIFVKVCQYENRGSALKGVEELIMSLNMHLSHLLKSYEGGFYGGICSLEENSVCNSEEILCNARQGLIYAQKNHMHCALGTRSMVIESERNERLLSRVSTAVERGEFEPYFQFVVNTEGKIVGAEAVSRWNNPEEGVLMPSKYIDMMIKNGMIIEHDIYMFRCACEKLVKWKNTENNKLFISINFAWQSISHGDFLDGIRRATSQCDFSHELMVIEITEDFITQNQEIVGRTIKALSEMGFRVALDDIGVRCASVLDKCDFPLNMVKIDRKLILNTEGVDRVGLLREITQLSHDRGLKVICKGVETRAQVDIAIGADCDFLQGFFFSRVLPEIEADRYLKSFLTNIYINPMYGKKD